MCPCSAFFCCSLEFDRKSLILQGVLGTVRNAQFVVYPEAEDQHFLI